MSESAKVDSIDALLQFRAALVKFAEAALVALADAESEVVRTQTWLENEQMVHWQMQIRKRNDLLGRAKEALRMKKLFKDSSGRTPHAVEEEKAVRIAQARVEEAEQKLVNTKKNTRVLQRELQNYKGSVQRFATAVQSDVPSAVALLGTLATTLQEYASLAPADMGTGVVESKQANVPPPPTEQEN